MKSVRDTKNAVEHLARELGLSREAVGSALALLAEGATVPFIARYRKEQTGGLDEVQLRSIQDRHERWMMLEKRRRAILDSLKRQGALTPELERAVAGASDPRALEDVYLPYRPRRQTRADRARDAGLEPLAGAILRDHARTVGELAGAAATDLGLSRAVCLEGAADIIAADLAAGPDLRTALRDLFRRQGAVTSRKKKKTPAEGATGGKSVRDAETWRDYFEWREPARACPSHRLLAVLRGEAEGVLHVEIRPPEAAAMRSVLDHLIRKSGTGGSDVIAHERRNLYQKIAEDAYRRLLAPALETEARKELRDRAEDAAAGVFAANLEDLLMAPPLGPRPVLAIDPGFRTGSKVATLDATGRVLEHCAIFPLPPRDDRDAAERRLRDLVSSYQPEAIAVGSGTGGRETEAFVRTLGLTSDKDEPIPVVRVNEAGASVYSASEGARKELPDLDVTVRGAVSIGRRLQDPLSELVKIDPAAVGVGQYQHDIDAGRLERALTRTVESCVNAVGVELNTAGTALLARVSGVGAALAAAITQHRDSHGLFTERTGIRAVAGVGPRTVEQAVGFLRCSGVGNPLENTGVHPERYDVVERMARDLGCTPADLCGNGEILDSIDPRAYVSSGTDGPGLPTIEDILQELRAPGRDPRREFVPVEFREGINTIEDLSDGMVLTGVVTNVTRFGAFVDIGVHRDGLIHISRLSDTFVRDPREIVRVGQQVEVTVLAVDRARERIDLQVCG